MKLAVGGDSAAPTILSKSYRLLRYTWVYLQWIWCSWLPKLPRILCEMTRVAAIVRFKVTQGHSTDFSADRKPVCDLLIVNNDVIPRTVSDISWRIGSNYRFWQVVPLSNSLVWWKLLNPGLRNLVSKHRHTTL